MITSIVLTTFTSIRARAEFVHCQSQSLVGLDAQGTKRHRTCDEMLHDALHTLHLIERCRRSSFLPTEEVADKDRALLLIYNLCPILEFIVVALSRRQLQLRNCLRVPRVLYAVLSPRELSLVLER